jgi:hypothetical protein
VCSNNYLCDLLHLIKRASQNGALAFAFDVSRRLPKLEEIANNDEIYRIVAPLRQFGKEAGKRLRPAEVFGRMPSTVGLPLQMCRLSLRIEKCGRLPVSGPCGGVTSSCKAAFGLCRAGPMKVTP